MTKHVDAAPQFYNTASFKFFQAYFNKFSAIKRKKPYDKA